MATKLELNHLDHKIYSAIKQIRGQKNRAVINSIDKEFVKGIDFESISKEFLNDRIEMLLQNVIALARVAHYMNLAQRRLIMNAFIFSVWILSTGMDAS